MKKKAIVTGAAGFIGSHMVDKLLAGGCEVAGIDNLSNGRLENLANAKTNKDFVFINEDISKPDRILQYFKGVDWVFHFAALADIVPSIVEPHKYHVANVDGTVSVLEASRKNNVKKFIYTASSSCYGVAKSVPTAETCPILPEYPYAITKYLGEQYCLYWAKVYKLPVISLRLFNVYGPRSRTSGTYGAVFGVFLAQKLANRPLTVVGDGSQKRDFVYVTDVADTFFAAAQSDVKDEIFNVGTGVPQSVNKLVELLGSDKICIPKRPGEPDCTWADISKIKRMLGWQPKVSFEEGVRYILENIDYWKQAPVWTPQAIEAATKDWFKYLGEAK